MGRSKYGVEFGDLSAHGQAAVRAADQLGARTVIYRDEVPIAAIVSADELNHLEPLTPGSEGRPDPLLALCGRCDNDDFVDQFNTELSTTRLFKRTLTRGSKLRK